MERYLTPFMVYMAAVSVGSIIVTVLDKAAAKRHAWRVPERTLLILAALGGAPAMLVTMLIIRHTTSHLQCMSGMPLIILPQAVAAVLILRNL